MVERDTSDTGINPNYRRKKRDLSKTTNFMTMVTEDGMDIYILPDPDYT